MGVVVLKIPVCSRRRSRWAARPSQSWRRGGRWWARGGAVACGKAPVSLAKCHEVGGARLPIPNHSGAFSRVRKPGCPFQARAVALGSCPAGQALPARRHLPGHPSPTRFACRNTQFGGVVGCGLLCRPTVSRRSRRQGLRARVAPACALRSSSNPDRCAAT
jgi:hypothetical protein